MSDVLDIETDGHVRFLRLNRPDRKNALTNELGWAIVEAVRAASADDTVRAIGIVGHGDAFCSGLDLAGSGDDDEKPTGPLTPHEQTVDDLGWVGRFPLTMRIECDKPVVAGLNGVAVGAGLSLAMSADLRIATASARFHPGYARVGTSPDGGLTWTLPQAVGYERALRFLLEQRMIGADEALALGMVGDVVADDEFHQRFTDYCHQMAAVAPVAARQTKRLLRAATVHTDLEAHAGNEIRWALRGLQTEDSAAAMEAMAAKSTPTFEGR
jgi:2-(1,2-epoxy-1,2-dihydrophenyl)acetyl-CoA isomerase